jgi:hypothetical protein
MALWEFLLWGAFGGIAIEAVELLAAAKRAKALPWRVPGEVTFGVMMFCIGLRLLLGATVAVLLGSAGQVSGALGAVAAGVAAPLILEQMGKRLPDAKPQAGDADGERTPPIVDVRDSQGVQIGDGAVYSSTLGGEPPLPRPPLPSGGSVSPAPPPYRPHGGFELRTKSARSFNWRSIPEWLGPQVVAGLTRSTPAFGGTRRVES